MTNVSRAAPSNMWMGADGIGAVTAPGFAALLDDPHRPSTPPVAFDAFGMFGRCDPLVASNGSIETTGMPDRISSVDRADMAPNDPKARRLAPPPDGHGTKPSSVDARLVFDHDRVASNLKAFPGIAAGPPTNTVRNTRERGSAGPERSSAATGQELPERPSAGPWLRLEGMAGINLAIRWPGAELGDAAVRDRMRAVFAEHGYTLETLILDGHVIPLKGVRHGARAR